MSLTSTLLLIAGYLILIANFTRYVPPPKVCQKYLIFYLAVYTWSISSLLSFSQYLSTKALNYAILNQFNFMFYFINKILLHIIYLNLENQCITDQWLHDLHIRSKSFTLLKASLCLFLSYNGKKINIWE